MRVWNWLRDSGNQGALASLALLVGGAWAVFLYVRGETRESRDEQPPPALTRDMPLKEVAPTPIESPPLNADVPSGTQTTPEPSKEVTPVSLPKEKATQAPAPVPSPKPITRSRVTAQLDPITVKYYPGNRSYIIVGTTVTVRNTSQQALQMAVHSLSLKLGDGTTLNAKKVESLPFCLHGLSFACERLIRSSEAFPPDSEVALNVEFSKAVGPKARIGRTGTATLSGAMWTLAAEDANADFKQSPIHVAGITQEFMLD